MQPISVHRRSDEPDVLGSRVGVEGILAADSGHVDVVYENGDSNVRGGELGDVPCYCRMLASIEVVRKFVGLYYNRSGRRRPRCCS